MIESLACCLVKFGTSFGRSNVLSFIWYFDGILIRYLSCFVVVVVVLCRVVFPTKATM